eukprot:3209483-Prymnesium_polylepis.1
MPVSKAGFAPTVTETWVRSPSPAGRDGASITGSPEDTNLPGANAPSSTASTPLSITSLLM